MSNHEDGQTAFSIETARGFIAATPMAGWLGLSLDTAAPERRYRLTFSEAHIGNPLIRALHGGVISAFLEVAMQAETTGLLGFENHEDVDFRSVSFDVDFLTSSKAADMTAAVTVERMGRRLVFLSAVGWQADDARPVARGRLCLRVGNRETHAGEK